MSHSLHFLCRSVVLWQGPPGTGKPTTLTGLLTVMVAANAALGARPGVPARRGSASAQVTDPCSAATPFPPHSHPLHPALPPCYHSHPPLPHLSDPIHFHHSHNNLNLATSTTPTPSRPPLPSFPRSTSAAPLPSNLRLWVPSWPARAPMLRRTTSSRGC